MFTQAVDISRHASIIAFKMPRYGFSLLLDIRNEATLGGNLVLHFLDKYRIFISSITALSM